MAKPLGEKSALIREAITANPDTGNTELAAMINGSDARKLDKIKVTAQDVAAQRQALKKAGGLPAGRNGAARKRGRKPGRKRASATVAPAAAPALARPKAGPVELIDRVFDMADECGGLDQLKRLVNRLAGVRA